MFWGRPLATSLVWPVVNQVLLCSNGHLEQETNMSGLPQGDGLMGRSQNTLIGWERLSTTRAQDDNRWLIAGIRSSAERHHVNGLWVGRG